MYEEYVGPLLGVRNAGDAMTLGTWWWDLNLLARPDKKTGLTARMAFDMLVKEHISEIYLEADPAQMAPWGSAPVRDEATLEQMAAFIGRCTATDMRVAALLGRGGKEALAWFADGSGYPEITAYIEGVAAYNAHVPAEQRFYGVHLDLEPDMSDDYLKYRSQMRRFLLHARELCDRHSLRLELDVNAWYDDSQVAIDENGREVMMGDVVTTACHAITVMAYRANAADQLDIADYLIEAARRNNCAINIGCETSSPESLGEEAFITYANFPPKIRAAEQRILRDALEEKDLPAGFGLAVHWVNSWYAMNMQTAG
ncbi:MAG TPA: hypothetical protein H9684_02895 [Firmicutes bacterium]|nr:hypothetical protein [Bacillota bacterium]